jgi:hypothetical protein
LARICSCNFSRDLKVGAIQFTPAFGRWLEFSPPTNSPVPAVAGAMR